MIFTLSWVCTDYGSYVKLVAKICRETALLEKYNIFMYPGRTWRITSTRSWTTDTKDIPGCVDVFPGCLSMLLLLFHLCGTAVRCHTREGEDIVFCKELTTWVSPGCSFEQHSQPNTAEQVQDEEKTRWKCRRHFPNRSIEKLKHITLVLKRISS